MKTAVQGLVAASVASACLLASADADACYMAFVHGWGRNMSDRDSPPPLPHPSEMKFPRPPDGQWTLADDTYNQHDRVRFYWWPYTGLTATSHDWRDAFVYSAANAPYYQPMPVSGFGDYHHPIERPRIDPAVAPPCKYYVAGYQGQKAFWDPTPDANRLTADGSEGAAGVVAQQLGEWIDREQIPDGQVILVGQSMGGLIIRWMLNQGVSNAPYFRSDYAKVLQKTKYAITNGTPHLGAPAADRILEHGNTPGVALSTNRSTACMELGAEALRLVSTGQYFGPAVHSMQTAVMKQASAQGGWLGDQGRTKVLHTVAGTNWTPDSTYTGTATGTNKEAIDGDLLMMVYWACLKGPRDEDHFVQAGLHTGGVTSVVASDGLVPRASAHGLFDNNNRYTSWATSATVCPEVMPDPTNTKYVPDCDVSWAEQRIIEGPVRMWLDMDVNHHNLRFNNQSREIRDWFRRKEETGSWWIGKDYLADYIAKYGRDLDRY